MKKRAAFILALALLEPGGRSDAVSAASTYYYNITPVSQRRGYSFDIALAAGESSCATTARDRPGEDRHYNTAARRIAPPTATVIGIVPNDHGQDSRQYIRDRHQDLQRNGFHIQHLHACRRFTATVSLLHEAEQLLHERFYRRKSHLTAGVKDASNNVHFPV
jgi:hypothetical protein